MVNENLNAISSISVSVAYALPEKQFLIPVTIAEGSTVQDVIHTSKILLLRREIELDKCKVGIFSRIVKLDDVLKDGDRVEIYRPLIADPKVLRRQRAEQANKT